MGNSISGESFFGGLLEGVGQGLLGREQAKYQKKLKDAESRQRAYEIISQDQDVPMSVHVAALKALIAPTMGDSTSKGKGKGKQQPNPLDSIFDSIVQIPDKTKAQSQISPQGGNQEQSGTQAGTPPLPQGVRTTFPTSTPPLPNLTMRQMRAQQEEQARLDEYKAKSDIEEQNAAKHRAQIKSEVFKATGNEEQATLASLGIQRLPEIPITSGQLDSIKNQASLAVSDLPANVSKPMMAVFNASLGMAENSKDINAALKELQVSRKTYLDELAKARTEDERERHNQAMERDAARRLDLIAEKMAKSEQPLDENTIESLTDAWSKGYIFPTATTKWAPMAIAYAKANNITLPQAPSVQAQTSTSEQTKPGGLGGLLPPIKTSTTTTRQKKTAQAAPPGASAEVYDKDGKNLIGHVVNGKYVPVGQ